jgi:hypothetical protein
MQHWLAAKSRADKTGNSSETRRLFILFPLTLHVLIPQAN